MQGIKTCISNHYMRYVMIDYFTTEDIQRQPSSQRNQRRRQGDDNGDVWKAVSWKEVKKKVEIPSDVKQAELLQVSIEKSFPKSKIPAMRQELRSRRHVFERTLARQLHALNPYAGRR